jgi:hypothetical protein
MTLRFPATAFFVALGFLLSSAAHACATCGRTPSADAATGRSAGPGWRISLDYAYPDQSRLRSGISHAF